MHPAAVVVRELVALRNRIRQEGDYAHLSAMEEFNAKYVQAIEYKRKSEKYEGSPISVIILQVDGDDPYLLDKCVGDIVSVVEQQDNVDIIVAADDKEGERFWEDRHKLSAIAKRTSGFKMNEDVVIPMFPFDLPGGLYEVAREWLTWSGRYTYHFLAVFLGKAGEIRPLYGLVCAGVAAQFGLGLFGLARVVSVQRGAAAFCGLLGVLVVLAGHQSLPNFYLLTDVLTMRAVA